MPPNERWPEVVASSHRGNDHLATGQIIEPLKSIATRMHGQLVRKRGWETTLNRQLAHDLVKEIGVDCWDGKHAMIQRVHDILVSRNPQTDITLRRVRAFWHGEPAVVAFSEIIELAAAAAFVQEMRHAE